MADKFNNAEIFCWMPLTGFDKDLPDKGVSTLISRAGYAPHGVCLFVFHPDIVHQHDGMASEKILPPDNCSYYANPYNEERRRQEWTNYDLRDLAGKLREENIECFISIMGTELGNRFHDEWIYSHPEIKTTFAGGNYGIHPLKRFSDGTYYEDFFADRVCEVMEDYGFTGLHVSDGFCPQPGPIYDGDYSYDFLDQFLSHTKIKVPDYIVENREDTEENVFARREYIWKNHRAEWMRFYAFRWGQFWKKLCDRLHAIGKKVFVLGMYCTDPFVTLYTNGIDLRKISEAGVDYLMPNMHANTSMIAHRRPWRYYEWANMMSLTDVFAPKSKKLNMLSVKDAAEQWDMLHHAPMLLDRDISFLTSYMRYTGDEKLRRCLDGYNICLADGIYDEEWKWLRERFEVAFEEIPEKVLTPTLVWSDAAFDRHLDEYVKNRRWSTHKFIYEVNKAGAHCATIARVEDLADECGDLFVPNFDLFSEEEREKLINYTGGALIATAEAESFDKEKYDLDFYCEDKNSPYPMCVFVRNAELERKDELYAISEEDDGQGEIIDPENCRELINTLNEFMPYQKVSSGIIKVLAALLKRPFADIVSSDYPIIPMQMRDGRIRLYAMNDDILHYGHANITVARDLEKVENISRFPLLPVKFSDTGRFNYLSQDYPGDLHTFRLLIAQGGLSIVDLYFKK